jgi:hypothetical protein
LRLLLQLPLQAGLARVLLLFRAALTDLTAAIAASNPQLPLRGSQHRCISGDCRPSAG